MGCSPAAFRVKFARLVHKAGLLKCNWKPYSLRPGGATTDFLHHGQLDRTTARLHIDDAVSMQAQLVVTMSAKSHHGEVGCMGPLQLGRLRRPSSGRETGSSGHSPRATGTCQKSAGRELCVHQDCSPQIRSAECMKASFANVGFTATRERWIPWARLPLPGSSRSAVDGAIGPLWCRCCSRTLR